MQKLQITVIHVEECEECEALMCLINKAVEETIGLANLALVDLNCEDDKAVDFAVEHDIIDLPVCVIGSKTLYGSTNNNMYSYIYKKIKEGINLAWQPI